KMAPLWQPLILLVLGFASVFAYDASWESLDKRPLPEWYDDAKIGIFVHWGTYSVPSFGIPGAHGYPGKQGMGEWFWKRLEEGEPHNVAFMKDNYPTFTYQDFAAEFTAEFFDPNYWAKVFQDSGTKYVVLTSKHHEGYTMWPSKY
ncbi:unnamed protein product, partial [Meganyctiphanes norvegica]